MEMFKSRRSEEGKEIQYFRITAEEGVDAVSRLFEEYNDSLNVDLSFQNIDEELDSLPGDYAPPDGELILAQVDGQPAGSVALRKLCENIAEMKRLYVRKANRGLGLGNELITTILEIAGEKGYTHVRLDSFPEMDTAQGIYETFGFYDIEPYTHNPVEGARFLEIKLD